MNADKPQSQRCCESWQMCTTMFSVYEYIDTEAVVWRDHCHQHWDSAIIVLHIN